MSEGRHFRGGRAVSKVKFDPITYPNYRIEEIISADELKQMVERVAAELEEYYRSVGAKEVLLVCILKGASPFHADLLRALKMPAMVDFMQVSSYIGTKSSGELVIRKDLNEDITGKHVVIVEDILDSGFTLTLLLEKLRQRDPASLKLCVALDKKVQRQYPIKPDFVGMQVEDKFVVGYGLDYEEYFRGLPYVGELFLPEEFA